MKTLIYGLFDHADPKATIVYVGKTTNLDLRLQSHRGVPHTDVTKWVKHIRKQGGDIRCRLLESCNNITAVEQERYWITKLRPPLNNRYNTGHYKPFVERQLTPRLVPSVAFGEFDGTVDELVLLYAQHTLALNNGNKQVTARQLGIGRQTLYTLLNVKRDSVPAVELYV